MCRPIRTDLIVMGITLLVVGCAGKLDYVRPLSVSVTDNSKIINKPRDAVWNTAVPLLGKQFFVINNLDKSSGLINLSYSGDPENYIDCGRIISFVQNLRGTRNYDFPAAKAQETYEVMDQASLFLVQRRVTLEGRMNLIFEEMGPDKTKVTANTRYVVTRSITAQRVSQVVPWTQTDSISFNSGSSAYFPARSDGRAVECVPTGKLEWGILSLMD